MRIIGADDISPHGEPAHVGWTELDARTHESVDQHAHNFYEAFWVLSGKGMHQVNGQAQHLRKNDLVCVRPDDITGA